MVVKSKKKGKRTMSINDKKVIAEKIRSSYERCEASDLDELRELDREVRRPAMLFAYIFGAIAAIVMGSGMSLVMTEIGSIIGIENGMIIGICIGVVGLAMALVNYPIYHRILESRKDAYADEIIGISERIINN